MFDKPKFIFWPVGNGDSSSIVLKKGIVFQIDLRHLKSASEGDDRGHVAIIDKLIENLPHIDGRPYLSGFALTHPDEDHISGFDELLEKVTIGELWFTPRIFDEYNKDLCDDAKKFRKEALRRVAETINTGGNSKSGDRVRIIGYDDILEDDIFKGFPRKLITVPGNSITELDGEDYTDEFNAFIHSPFKENIGGERNDSSLAMQVVLCQDASNGGVLFFGDLSYSGLRKIFDQTKSNENQEFLAWKVLLAPHHCSKSAMYQKADGVEKLKQDILDDLDESQVEGGCIVSSSEEIPKKNEEGDNPPHRKAKNKYEEIVSGRFLCTQEDGGTSEPIIFDFVNGTLICTIGKTGTTNGGDPNKKAVEKGRGGKEPPTEKTGFGRYANK